MQRPRNPDDDEDDTAFGGLAPRGGPGRGKIAEPARTGRGKWVALAAVAVVVVLMLLYVTGRL
ncbi:hypothetical protein [Variovorax sp. GT1P44]|uniref:hypothetical protein n=1 Tax=Variovorax sp. GT1P44 TaxID=3443742 RepID=UPI003F466830